MRRSSTLSVFPDVNVWVALTLESHIHNAIAARWLAGVSSNSRICFCRITQLSLLRLLTTEAVMGPDVISQTEAWKAYDRWLEDTRINFADEPPGLEPALRAYSQGKQSSPKEWADAYLIAFAAATEFTLVSFDRSFRNRTKNLILLTD
jgi:uncharacterized protein